MNQGKVTLLALLKSPRTLLGPASVVAAAEGTDFPGSAVTFFAAAGRVTGFVAAAAMVVEDRVFSEFTTLRVRVVCFPFQSISILC